MKGPVYEDYFAYSKLVIIHYKEMMLMKQSLDIANLRQRAEQAEAQCSDKLLNQADLDITKLKPEQIQTLIHELQVHQIELEMQNDELKNTQQALNKSQTDYARIYNLAPVAYLTLSLQGTILQANLAATTLLNTPLSSLLSQRLDNFIHADDQDAYYLFFHKLKNEQLSTKLLIRITQPNQAKHEPRNPNSDFHEYAPNQHPESPVFTYLELKATVDRQENNELNIYLALKDVTAYKFLEDTLTRLNKKQVAEIRTQQSDLIAHRQLLHTTNAELEKSQKISSELKATHSHIFNASSEGIIMLNLLGIVESSNTAACLLLGYEEAQLLGMSFNQLLISPFFTESSIDLLLRNTSNNAALNYSVDGLHRKGFIVPLSLSLVNFRLKQADHFAIPIRDNSLRLRQEQHEKEHLAEIAHMTRLSLIGSMGSGIAHQVNQPLTAISNYSQACLQLIKAENPDLTKLSEVLSKTYAQAQKAGKIIHRMKDLASQRTTTRSMTSIDTLIENAVNFCAHECYQHNIKVTLELKPNMPKVAIDSVQIEQVLLNLIKNAIDALEEKLNADDKTISIQTRLNKGLEVRIKDNGPGLTDLQKVKILMPFYTSKASGMGMGLSISRSIIEAHGGMIRFDSLLGAGTTFYFILPINGEYL